MTNCAICQKKISYWEAHSDEGGSYCDKCWNKKEYNKPYKEKQRINANNEKIKKDKELVRRIYEKRKNGVDLTSEEKWRVMGTTLWSLFTVCLLTLGVGLIFFRMPAHIRLLDFEANHRGAHIKDDYGIGKEYD